MVAARTWLVFMVRIKQLIKSFQHAFRGVAVLLKTEQSFRLQFVVALIVISFLFVFSVPVFETIVVLLLVAAVLILEMINSIFERLVDAFKPRIHPIVGEIKDIMAATVLFVSCLAALIGGFIFFPYFFRLFS